MISSSARWTARRAHRVRRKRHEAESWAATPTATVRPWTLRVVDHPLVAHKLTLLRDESTDSPTFRRLTEELVTLLAYEATREVRVEPTHRADPGRPGRTGSS